MQPGGLAANSQDCTLLWFITIQPNSSHPLFLISVLRSFSKHPYTNNNNKKKKGEEEEEETKLLNWSTMKNMQ